MEAQVEGLPATCSRAHGGHAQPNSGPRVHTLPSLTVLPLKFPSVPTRETQKPGLLLPFRHPALNCRVIIDLDLHSSPQNTRHFPPLAQCRGAERTTARCVFVPDVTWGPTRQHGAHRDSAGGDSRPATRFRTVHLQERARRPGPGGPRHESTSLVT